MGLAVHASVVEPRGLSSRSPASAWAKPLAFRLRVGGGPVGVVGGRKSGPSLQGDAKMGSSGLSGSTLKLAWEPLGCRNQCHRGSNECVKL